MHCSRKVDCLLSEAQLVGFCSSPVNGAVVFKKNSCLANLWNRSTGLIYLERA